MTFYCKYCKKEFISEEEIKIHKRSSSYNIEKFSYAVKTDDGLASIINSQAKIFFKIDGERLSGPQNRLIVKKGDTQSITIQATNGNGFLHKISVVHIDGDKEGIMAEIPSMNYKLKKQKIVVSVTASSESSRIVLVVETAQKGVPEHGIGGVLIQSEPEPEKRVVRRGVKFRLEVRNPEFLKRAELTDEQIKTMIDEDPSLIADQVSHSWVYKYVYMYIVISSNGMLNVVFHCLFVARLVVTFITTGRI